MAREPLRKKFAKKADNGFGVLATILTGALASGGGVFMLTSDKIDLDHTEQREEVRQILDERLDHLAGLKMQTQDLQRQFDMAALNNNLSERDRLSEQIDRNTRHVRWLSQEYAKVMLRSDAIHEGDFKEYAQRFQEAGLDRKTAIVIDPRYAQWRDQARENLPMNAGFHDYLAMSKDMEARHENRIGAAATIAFISAFPLLFLTLFSGGSLMSRWKRLPDRPDRPNKSGGGLKNLLRGRQSKPKH
ncbi:MAG: hypothetical protein EA357_00115 [Micavibrio sp.]|nr:MAG: hypothetical protein EA357_00115 [Micavibrio sp.]